MGGTDAGNYAVTVNNADLTINKANMSVAMGAQSKTYDGTTSATLASGAITATGVSVNGVAEIATVSQTAGTYNSKNVLDASSVTASLASSDFTAASGVDLGNYNLPTTVTGTGAITPKKVTLSGSRAYDGTITIAAGDLTVATGVSVGGKVEVLSLAARAGWPIRTSYMGRNVQVRFEINNF